MKWRSNRGRGAIFCLCAALVMALALGGGVSYASDTESKWSLLNLRSGETVLQAEMKGDLIIYHYHLFDTEDETCHFDYVCRFQQDGTLAIMFNDENLMNGLETSRITSYAYIVNGESIDYYSTAYYTTNGMEFLIDVDNTGRILDMMYDNPGMNVILLFTEMGDTLGPASVALPCDDYFMRTYPLIDPNYASRVPTPSPEPTPEPIQAVPFVNVATFEEDDDLSSPDGSVRRGAAKVTKEGYYLLDIDVKTTTQAESFVFESEFPFLEEAAGELSLPENAGQVFPLRAVTWLEPGNYNISTNSEACTVELFPVLEIDEQTSDFSFGLVYCLNVEEPFSYSLTFPETVEGELVFLYGEGTDTLLAFETHDPMEEEGEVHLDYPAGIAVLDFRDLTR